jgi:hypothetical protein
MTVHLATLIDHTYSYLDAMEACLEVDNVEHLSHLEHHYADVITEVSALTPEEHGSFAGDLRQITERLTRLRDTMVSAQLSRKAQLEGMGSTSRAAKAYTKSNLAGGSENG